jgi:hypothetical protein
MDGLSHATLGGSCHLLVTESDISRTLIGPWEQLTEVTHSKIGSHCPSAFRRGWAD